MHLSEHEERVFSNIKRMAPSCADELWSSKNATLEALSHPVTEVRAAAILCGAERWRLCPDKQFFERCCSAVEFGDDLECEIAVGVLSEEFSGSGNNVIAKALAQVVKCEDRSNFARNHAFRGLREVCYGRDMSIILERLAENAAILKGDAITLDISDWSLVDNALQNRDR